MKAKTKKHEFGVGRNLTKKCRSKKKNIRADIFTGSYKKGGAVNI